MMWHLKDRYLEKSLLKTDPQFLEKLNRAYEAAFEGTDADIEVEIVLNKGVSYTANISTLTLEKRPDYNPNTWNAYPDVDPPEGVMMQIIEEVGNGILRRTCALFNDGNWTYEYDGEPGYSCRSDVKFFRPWEDPE